jgi:hypothetical protein
MDKSPCSGATDQMHNTRESEAILFIEHPTLSKSSVQVSCCISSSESFRKLNLEIQKAGMDKRFINPVPLSVWHLSI